MNSAIFNQLKTICYHCGENCEYESINDHEKQFCCYGCKMVYELINKVNLCAYYDLNKTPGASQKTSVRKDKFAFLDDETVKFKLILFKDEKQSNAIFYLPQMHCSSCIWLLENLNKLNKGIIQSRVNFLKKEVSITFNNHLTSLRQAAELLANIGYEPHISLNELSEKKIKKYDRSSIYKIGIAGFCFGNIMMFSFPEYFSFGNIEEKGLKSLFYFLNLGLSLPVFFYCASEFFISAWKSLKQKFLNIDAPISLAIMITFTRSAYEIISGTGAGYLDSMAGIVFFMLLGRFFQNKTYNTISFNRDYTSYFPLGVTIIDENGIEKQSSVSKLKAGQRIKVHSNEIVPADAILFLGKAQIDYSFVTGESLPVQKSIGEIIYAGGKQTGGAIELEVVKEVSQSYLTQLWNNDVFKKDDHDKKKSFIHFVSRYFTVALFSVALSAAIYWYFHDVSQIMNSVTSVLIVACPCALLLSATFTNGNMLKVLQRFGFYAKNSNVIERIANADTIVFDKTGTITLQQQSQVKYEGPLLSAEMQQLIRSLVNQSSHPLSKAITASLPHSKTLPVKKFNEVIGMGITGNISGNKIIIGSEEFVFGRRSASMGSSKVYVCINNEVVGLYKITTSYREGFPELIAGLGQKYETALISGDNDSENIYLRSVFGNRAQIKFEQQAQDKLNYIKYLQQNKKNVIMVGDGLNDAGALKQSDVGIALTDNINNFSPACDVIMDGKSFKALGLLFEYCGKGKQIILCSFLISIIYNIVGLYFAFFGKLQPVIAAILMPVSSITIVLFTTGMSSILSFKLFKQYKNDNNNKNRQL